MLGAKTNRISDMWEVYGPRRLTAKQKTHQPFGDRAVEWGIAKYMFCNKTEVVRPDTTASLNSRGEKHATKLKTRPCLWLK
jgi:hypothetical protein